MINKIIYRLILFFFFILSCFSVSSSEQFLFNVTEVEILENGNLFKGLKRGTIQTTDGIIIDADKFIYNKKTNIVNAEGEVRVEDNVNNYTIYSDKVTYSKNDEIISTEGNSRAFDQKNKIITAEKFTYYKIPNIFNAKENAKIKDINENYTIFAENITYFINKGEIITEGDTSAEIESKYNIKSQDVEYLEESQQLSSKKKNNFKR